MAWQRDEANLGISGATAYSYTEVDWEVHGDRCTYRHIGGVTSPYNFGATAASTLQWWEGGTWHDYAGPASGTFGGYGDLALVDVEDSFVRQAADRTVSLGCYTTMMGGSARAWIDYTVPHLAPSVNWAASNPVVRNSDNSITLTWDAPSLEYSAMCLEVSTDGGSWSQFAVLWNTATSYTWTGCSAGHSYQFRIRSNYLASYSDYDVCATVIVNTPLPPESISTAAAGGTSVTVNLVNPSMVATSVEYQVSTDGGTTWGATQTSANLTSFTATVTGTGKIRVRNVNSTGASAWLVSEAITTITPPAAPTLTAPAGSIIDLASGSVDFEWAFNSIDGSAQSAFEFSLSKNGGTATVTSGTTAKKVTQSLSSFAAGDTIAIKVRTKGADANWGAWSATKTYNVYSAPTVSITSPSATITSMPIQLNATYSDMAGFTCQYAHVSLTQGGRVLFDEDADINGSSITASLDVSEFIPTNGESYTVVLDVRSSSSLQSSANATFLVDFTEPTAGTLGIMNDPSTGYASLIATFDNHATDVEYSGETNEQFDTEDSNMFSLVVKGKSVKWCQLYGFPRSGNTTENSLKRTYGADNIIIFDGTPSARGIWYLSTSQYPVTFKKDNKYLMKCIPIGTPNNKVYAMFQPLGVTVSNGGVIFTPTSTTSTNGAFRIQTDTGVTHTNYMVRILLFDLTYMFGAGNEPATVEEFDALYPDSCYEYDTGSLRSVNSVSVLGLNLADTSTLYNRYIQYRNTDDATWKESSDSRSFAIPVKAGTTYAVKTYNSNVTILRVACVASLPTGSEDVASTNSKSNALQYTITPNDGERYLVVQSGKAYLDAGTAQIMVVEGSEYPTEYSPYTATTIAATLRSAGSVHDELQVEQTACSVLRKIGTRAYVSGDESDHDVLTDGTNTYYSLTTPTTEALSGISPVELGDATTIVTDLDSTFDMVGHDSSTDAVSVSVARVNADNSTTPLITDGASGAGAVDRYAPLNTAYQYAVTTKSSANAVKTVFVDNEIVTDLWFAYWTHKDGDTVTEMTASAKWNPDNGGIQVSRPQKTRVYYAGRKDPVSYDGSAVALSETPSWMLVDRSEAQPFVQLIEDGGRGVYKSCDGWVYHADFDLTLSPKYTAIGYYGGIMLSVTRIAGDQL